MPSDSNMLGPLVEPGVLRHRNRPIVIAASQDRGALGKSQFYVQVPQLEASRAVSDSATYSASVNDSATVVCFLDLHVMALFAVIKMYPEMVLQSSAFA